ncbi:MAG TPA: hypothetical protein VFG04_18485 [Planctomycetaceae bacterium]|jgi:hypothetical protein|nr:hypothetical protein [Planctomycetaceae bacterium]
MCGADADKPDGKRHRWITIGIAILATYIISGLMLVTLDQLGWLNRAVVDALLPAFTPFMWIVRSLNEALESKMVP